MHLDEVECVVWELIGHFVPLHGWSAGTAARPVNRGEQRKDIKKHERISSVSNAGGKEQFFGPELEQRFYLPKINKTLTLYHKILVSKGFTEGTRCLLFSNLEVRH